MRKSGQDSLCSNLLAAVRPRKKIRRPMDEFGHCGREVHRMRPPERRQRAIRESQIKLDGPVLRVEIVEFIRLKCGCKYARSGIETVQSWHYCVCEAGIVTQKLQAHVTRYLASEREQARAELWLKEDIEGFLNC